MAPPAKRAKLLSDEDDSSSDSEGGVDLTGGNASGLKINEEFAKRFEHNKKREEKHRLEEKFKLPNGKTKIPSGQGARDDEEDEESEESTDESEDDDAELATKDLDDEIAATLQAIRSKDPKVYDSKVKFYRDWEQGDAATEKEKRDKPMYLQDYHRQQLLAGNAGGEDAEEMESRPQTYQEEQDALRRDVVGQMHGDADEDEAESDGDFMVKKQKPKHDNIPVTSNGVHPSRVKRLEAPKVEDADKDPETFLSNFMAARAWLPADGSRWQAFDSDDSDEERRADEFEEAYNMRFEDPAAANEKLRSFARDAAQHSVRREDKSGRKKGRERERELKAAAKEERRRERDRLKKLKMDEVEEKVARIREAAGLRKGEELELDEWKHVLDDDFDDEAWEKEMKRRFGDKYYSDDDVGFGDGPGSEAEADTKNSTTKKSSKPKKPKWENDIDIKDLVPDFEDDANGNPRFTLSTDDEEGNNDVPDMSNDENSAVPVTKKTKSSKDLAKQKLDAKRAARKERARIEELVDESLPLTNPSLAIDTTSQKAPVVGFRYRETSPTSFGLSARDILFAEDGQLNQFAGLKKFASFRDAEKKERDRKKFSKKARLRQWRKEVFGKADEPDGGFETVLGGTPILDRDGRGSNEAGKKRKRGNRNKKGKTTA